MKPLRWLGIVLGFTVISLLVAYFIPADSALVGVRYVLGFTFIVFLPGYCLENLLFLGKNRLDLIESLVLSIALSFGIAGLTGLILGLSPVGINFTSITYSLGAIVLALAIIGFVRRSKEKDLPVF